MTISDFFMIGAVIIAPLLAVQATKWIDSFNIKQQRKLYIFRTLMATRAFPARLSVEHVNALNMIDLEFYGRKIPFIRRYQTNKERKVTETWKIYLDALINPSTPLTQQNSYAERDQIFFNLLENMAEAVGYHFDRVQIKNGAYVPIAHAESSQKQTELQNNLIDCKSFKGKSGKIPLRNRYHKLVKPQFGVSVK